MVYSFIKIYLNVSKLNDLAKKTMESLWAEESTEDDDVIMHPKGYYATLDTHETLYYVVDLREHPARDSGNG